jgi:hypothetical protein
MSDLIFWVLVFVVLFLGLRWLQARGKGKNDE